LNYDGVPWNNNNAEHAVHHFAKLRRITDGTFTRSSIEQLLVLLTVLQTCEYRKVFFEVSSLWGTSVERDEGITNPGGVDHVGWQ